jgi:tRNA modification GTPase
MKDIADTICALSTPQGRSGIAVIRISGKKCFSIINALFIPKHKKTSLEHRTAVIGKIVRPSDRLEFDDAVVTCFHAPNSYTGEDLAEVSLHGSPILISTLLDALVESGARPAEPGEFTMRAFCNGKMDLTQAEAIHDIIEAKTLFQAQTAGRQHDGAVSKEIKIIKDLLIDIIVNMESAVEFVEDALQTDSREDLASKLKETQSRIKRWVESYRKGRVVQAGFSMAIIGLPNVGKSSLFNALLEKNRSIVTDIPGTTRDTVSDYTSIQGIPVHLLDTAGLHHSEDLIERMGIERSQQAIVDADAILFVIDAGREPSEQDFQLKTYIPSNNCIHVFNKSDLPKRWSKEDQDTLTGNGKSLEVSAKKGQGIEELRALILDTILGELPTEGLLITNLRHCRALETAEKHLETAALTLNQGLSEEFILLDLHKSLESLGEITGETHIEDLLTEIFSRFCIGK